MATGSGCTHYTRRCALVTPCCNRIYTCRLCHNEEENHELDRKAVQSIKCLQCDNIQEVSSHCEECEVKFGRYYCGICRLFDDQEKGQFHCDDCGICRIGGKKNFYHCPQCGICLGIQMKDSHKCIVNSAMSNCPICMEDMQTSRIASTKSPCGHMMHSTCMSELLNSGSYTCPMCNGSIIDMSPMWKQLDRDIEQTPMPEEYQNVLVKILCRDCHKETKIKFHVLGHKCEHCGSYNTSREGMEGLPDFPVPIAVELPDQQPVQEQAANGDEQAAENSEVVQETEREYEVVRVHLGPEAHGDESASVADIRLELDGEGSSDLPLD